ncbi:AAA family ATPase [Tumebacillus flagellatus]|uniref:ATPase AAA-type core domain-containing protein n=1 Tax=Tumebacillus flagellatus TaxID=1157490 RepID=A0A074MA41_9BACL|nr:AAA family ATPase [Tumebacillus flagellatus]KEO82827.1 hypothetical protein EL26_13030 [Tumebacillus flagellatus]
MKAIRLIRYKGFEDSGWVQLNKITLLFGLNSSGKSSLLNALLMLKQSLQNPARKVPFTFSDKKGVDVGNYSDVSYNHVINPDLPVEIHMKLDLGRDFESDDKSVQFGGGDFVFKVRIGYNPKNETNILAGITFEDNQGRNILSVDTRDNVVDGSNFTSDVIDVDGLTPRTLMFKWENFLPVVIRTPIDLFMFAELAYCVQEKVTEALEKVAHVGPLRSEAERVYQFTGESPKEVGRHGEDAFTILFLDRHEYQNPLTEKVNHWLREYNYEFHWETFGSFFQLILRDTRSGLQVNLKDVGFGISQILPIMIQGYLNNPEQIVLIEQPEIHLHAGAQAKLGDLFIDMVNQTGKTFLIETHSEHLLLRLRRRVAETTLTEGKNEFPLYPSDIAVNFIENTSNGSVVHNIKVSEIGQLENVPDAFRSFFADDFEETMKITETIARLKQQRQSGTE